MQASWDSLVCKLAQLRNPSRVVSLAELSRAQVFLGTAVQTWNFGSQAVSGGLAISHKTT